MIFVRSFDFLISYFVCAPLGTHQHRFFSGQENVFSPAAWPLADLAKPLLVCTCVCVCDQLAVWLTCPFHANSVRHIVLVTMNISDLLQTLPHSFHILGQLSRASCVCVSACVYYTTLFCVLASLWAVSANLCRCFCCFSHFFMLLLLVLFLLQQTHTFF